MEKESWEYWHDDYYDRLESDNEESLDDLEEWKKAEQIVIDKVINKIKGDYYG